MFSPKARFHRTAEWKYFVMGLTKDILTQNIGIWILIFHGSVILQRQKWIAVVAWSLVYAMEKFFQHFDFWVVGKSFFAKAAWLLDRYTCTLNVVSGKRRSQYRVQPVAIARITLQEQKLQKWWLQVDWLLWVLHCGWLRECKAFVHPGYQYVHELARLTKMGTVKEFDHTTFCWRWMAISYLECPPSFLIYWWRFVGKIMPNLASRRFLDLSLRWILICRTFYKTQLFHKEITAESSRWSSATPRERIPDSPTNYRSEPHLDRAGWRRLVLLLSQHGRHNKRIGLWYFPGTRGIPW